MVLRKVQKKLITQAQAGEKLTISARQVRQQLKALMARGEKALIHRLRGRDRKRKISDEKEGQIVAILCQDVYRGPARRCRANT